MEYVKKIDGLPGIPPELIPASSTLNPLLVESRAGRVIYRNGQEIQSGRYMRLSADDRLNNWIRDNIIDDFSDVGMALTSNPCHGAHVDQTRSWVLQYLVETGGSDVDTVFWAPQNEEYEFCHYSYETKEQVYGVRPGLGYYTYVENYDSLREITRYRLAPGNWYLIDAARIVHSVEQIETMRYAIQISLHSDPSEKLKVSAH